MVFNSSLTLISRNSSITYTYFIIIFTIFRRINILLIKLIRYAFAIRFKILSIIIDIAFPILFCTFTVLYKIFNYLIFFVYTFSLSFPSNIINLSSHQTIRIDFPIRIPIFIITKFRSWFVSTNTLAAM